MTKINNRQLQLMLSDHHQQQLHYYYWGPQRNYCWNVFLIIHCYPSFTLFSEFIHMVLSRLFTLVYYSQFQSQPRLKSLFGWPPLRAEVKWDACRARRCLYWHVIRRLTSWIVQGRSISSWPYRCQNTRAVQRNVIRGCWEGRVESKGSKKHYIYKGFIFSKSISRRFIHTVLHTYKLSRTVFFSYYFSLDSRKHYSNKNTTSESK